MPREEIIAWTQWPDLAAPDGVTMLSDPSGSPSAADCKRITFYVPHYMGGGAALEPVRRMPQLRVLQVPNAGYDDALAYLDREIVLCNARGVHDQSTAELAVGLAIGARRGFASFAAHQHDGRWAHQRFPSLADSTVAIVGYGSIGRTVRDMLRPFQVDVIPFTRSGQDGARRVSTLRDSVGDFDVIILVLPLNGDSVGMVDADFIARMREGAALVNVGRGGLVDTDALVAALQAGRISAGLDVTSPEPLPAGHPLWSAPNCIITPHVGGDSTAFEPRGRALVQHQLARLAAGQELANVVRVGPVDPATIRFGH